MEDKNKGGRPEKYGKGVKTCKLQLNVPIELHDELMSNLEVMIRVKLSKKKLN